MTILQPDTKAAMREVFLNQIHNSTCNVKKIIGTTTANANPVYVSDTINTLYVYPGFKCSYYYILSGKVNRMFEQRDIPIILETLGRTQEEIYVVQYVSDILLVDPSVVDPQPDILNNLKVDEEIQIEGKWWKVRQVVPDSEGVQHTALVVQ